MKKPLKTALIILNYNNASDTRGCLESLRQYNTAPVKVIVVDNDSRPEERKALTELMHELYGKNLWMGQATHASITPQALEADNVLLYSNENVGYARGNNLGLELAYADEQVQYVMILNNDILFVQDIVQPLIDWHKQLEGSALISPVLYKKDMEGLDLNCARRNITLHHLIRRNMNHYIWRAFGKNEQSAHKKRYMLIDVDIEALPTVLPIELPSGSCMLGTKELFQMIGGFDPATFLFYEENILYEKIKQLGLQNYIVLNLKCIHLGAATTSALPRAIAVMKHSLDSETYYVRNYLKPNPMLRFIHNLSTKFFLLTYRLQKSLKIHK